ncbi:uncharacterized protein LOC131687982 [Topomyia yanbarensis]|uniref:uncharacterized protein LOC131687982 n=1 Tax=Topomyia yanbarensis TaxID=2498891 RepID=UPI00273CC2AE|nr:uncharacterized protein LOC131687982 [Topomyia yanbarensis]
MAVQQLCDHLIAAELRDHLINPMLVQELVDKLPSSTKLEWVRFKRQQQVVDLATFSNFLSEIVSEASEVTLFVEPPREQQDRCGRERKDKRGKLKEQEAYLHSHVGVVDQPQIQHGQHNEHLTCREEGTNRKPCRICDRADHRIRFCDEFRKMSWDGRMREVEKRKLCQLCLNEHGQTRCRFKGHCGVGGCRERHHQLLHPTRTATTLRLADCNVHDMQTKQPVIFRMVPVTLHNGKMRIDVIAFLDEGSSYSLMEEQIADQIGLSGTVQPILVKWTAESVDQFVLRNVHTVEQLQLPEQKMCFADVAARYKHLNGLPVADYLHGAPRILIGLKHLHVYAPIESRIGQPGEPIAVRTQLGWTVYGPQDDSETSVGFAGHHVAKPMSDQNLHDLLRTHYTLDESGVSVTVLPESAEDRRARELLEQTTVRIGNRFETGLLWRANYPQLPNSFPMAVKRMQNLEKKLSKDLELQQVVRKQMDEYLRKGYAHKATAKELAETEEGKVWYLPLNMVLNAKKPGKLNSKGKAAD